MSRCSNLTTFVSAILAVISSQAIFIAASVAAVGSTPVRVVNPANDPALTRDVDNPATRPFAKRLCLSTAPAAPCNTAVPALSDSFSVPATTSAGETVKRLVIEHVSGICIGSARTTEVDLTAANGARTNPPTGDNFSINVFPMAVAQFAGATGANSVQAFAQQARIYYDPGMTVTLSFDFAQGGVLNCRVQLNGYFVVQ
jgi:hypothetical protein